MKIIHVESGLGNQMLSFCEYLAIKKANPNDNIYIENIIFDIPECNKIICQWNGYELERIFGIKAPNVRELFTMQQWQSIIYEIKNSEFWLRNWNYPVHFTNAFNNAGLNIKNIRGDFETGGAWMAYDQNREQSFRDRFKNKDWYVYLQYKKNKVQGRYLKKKYYVCTYKEQIYIL